MALALVSLQSQKPPVASSAAVESLVTQATAQIVPIQQFNSEFQLPFDQNMRLYDLFKELQEGPISGNGVYSITFIYIMEKQLICTNFILFTWPHFYHKMAER